MACLTCTRHRVSAPDIDPNGQLVSCIMPTANRRRFVPIAIENFLAQTYETKELIIIDDGERVDDLIPTNAGIKIRRRGMHWIGDKEHGQARHTTGGKLNYGIEMVALGTILAKWDDDDWRDPSFLATVIPLLKGHAAAGLQRALFYEMTSKKTWQLQQGPRMPIDASMVFWRKTWEQNPFPDVSLGEGQRFLRALPRVARVAADNDPALYVALRHEGNTTTWDPGPPGWHAASAGDLPSRFLAALARISG